MQLDIITPEKVLFSADAQMVVVPGSLGDFGVLDGHAPFISTIRPGVITIDTQSGEKRLVSIVGGIAEVVPEHCTILAEMAEECSSLTVADAQARIESAKAALDASKNDMERKQCEAKLAAAQALLDTLR